MMWNKCKDGMPSNDDYVLIREKDKSMWVASWNAHYGEWIEGKRCESIPAVRVTHWIALPEQPK